MTERPPAVLSPVLHLFMILLPTVANSFLLVYVLLGVVLENEQHLRWSREALPVAWYTAGAVVVFCLLVFGGLRAAGRPARHPLAVVNLVQIGLAVVLLGVVLALRAG